MAIQSSYSQVADQVINFNQNVVNLLSQINSLVTSSDASVQINLTDNSGVLRQFNLPSFGFLKSEIDRLNNNINSIYSINEAGALIQPTNGTKFKKVVTVDLNREPNDLNTLQLPTQFKSLKNWIFDGLLNPALFIEIDLSGQIENNVRKIQCRRYIPEFAKDVSGNFTPLGQSALNEFNNLFRNKNGFTLEEYEDWHSRTPGIVEPLNPNYDEQMFDLEPNILQLDGIFTVIRVEEDTLNRKLFYHVDTLNYFINTNIDNQIVKETKQLSVGDEMIVNTPISVTRYKIIEISTSASNPRLRFERVEGFEPIPVGVGTLKIYSPVLYKKRVRISVGYNERNVVFIKPLNMDNYILSKNWSRGIGFWTNDLRDVDSGLSMEQFYIDNVYDYGEVLKDLVAKKTPNKLAGTPNTVSLNAENFKVVQINKHLTDTPDSNLIKNKHNQQKNIKSEIEQLSDAVNEKNKQIKIQRFTSSAERKQFTNELDYLNKQKESKSKLLSTLTSEILDLSNSPNTKVQPVFRVRGFWAIPEPVITRGTKPQEIVQFRVNYKYVSKDGRESPVEVTRLVDGGTTGAFSNWIEFKTDVRKRVYDATTGEYSWQIEDVSDADTPNINQLDIPIKFGERVIIRVKSISEVGWPESPVESDWSSELSIDFPDSLNNVFNENDFILQEATREDLRVTVQNDLASRGLDEHLSDQVTVNNITYHHSTDKILSGFKDSNGNAQDLFEYLQALESRIRGLEERIRRSKGELEIIVYRNSEEFLVKNGSELVFNIECEDYLDNFTSAGVPTGRVYQNNIYVIKDFLIKIKNKSTESPLGLLSNRLYSSLNSEVYNTSLPQTFWVNQQNELLIDNNSGTSITSLASSKTQKDYQFIWCVNYDNFNQTTVTKLSENIGNNFITNNSNSITNILGSNEFNIGYSDPSVISFIGNNNSLFDVSKWIDDTVSVSSTQKLLTTIHPQIQSFDVIQETNSDKIKTIQGGQENDINIPINIYFKMNSLDSTKSGANYEYINLNSSNSTVKHVKKLKFLLENEADNRPFIFTIKFNINRSRVITTKTSISTPTQLISNR